jgi:hypothetical protein
MRPDGVTAVAGAWRYHLLHVDTAWQTVIAATMVAGMLVVSHAQRAAVAPAKPARDYPVKRVPDNPDGRVRNLRLPDDVTLVREFRPSLLNGIEVVTGQAVSRRARRNTIPDAAVHADSLLCVGEPRSRRDGGLDSARGSRRSPSPLPEPGLVEHGHHVDRPRRACDQRPGGRSLLVRPVRRLLPFLAEQGDHRVSGVRVSP